MSDPASPPRQARLGWAPLVVAVVVAVVLYVAGGAFVFSLPTPPELSGLTQFALSAAVPTAAFLAAVLVHRRGLAAFGFRRVPAKWLLIAVGVGFAAVGAATLIDAILASAFPGAVNVQSDYEAAAAGGLAVFLGVIALGGVIEPIGEELLFRGVLMSFLERWGGWVAVTLSSAVFSVAHGVNLVTLDAFVVGVGCGMLLWVTRSIWPSFVVHIVYNTTMLLLLALR